jgi:DNA-binding IclR family transcriptional regulator
MKNSVRHLRTPANGRDRRLASVDRALTALKLFLHEKGDWGVSELAARLGVHKSTAHALLRTLMAHDLVAPDPATRRYRLGSAAPAYGMANNGQAALREAAHPTLARLADGAGETAILCLPHDGRFQIADAVEPPDEMRVALPVGRHIPLACGCAGKAYLAWLDPAERERILRPVDLRRFTARSITRMPAYLAELRRVRERGYALDLEEYSPGVHAVGFPVRPPGRTPVGVICVVGLSHRMREETLHALGRKGLGLVADLGRALAPPRAHRPGHLSSGLRTGRRSARRGG